MGRGEEREREREEERERERERNEENGEEERALLPIILTFTHSLTHSLIHIRILSLPLSFTSTLILSVRPRSFPPFSGPSCVPPRHPPPCHAQGWVLPGSKIWTKEIKRKTEKEKYWCISLSQAKMLMKNKKKKGKKERFFHYYDCIWEIRKTSTILCVPPLLFFFLHRYISCLSPLLFF